MLGTASQVPTRTRNHNGYLLRWDAEGILFDPGEGTQRQMILAGVPATAITAICLTHFHGDHCLGLPGVLQRHVPGRRRPPGPADLPRRRAVSTSPGCAARRRTPTGWRWCRTPSRPTGRCSTWGAADPGGGGAGAPGADVRLPAGRARRPADGARAARRAGRGRAGRRPAAAGGLARTERGPVRLEEVSRARPGQRFAFVMDTAVCDGARWLAQRRGPARLRGDVRRRPTPTGPRRTGTSPPARPARSRPAGTRGGWSSPTSPSATPTSTPLLAEARRGARRRRPGPRPRPGAGAAAAPGSRRR